MPLAVAPLALLTIFGIFSAFDLCLRRVPNSLAGVAAVIVMGYPWFVTDGISVLSSYFGGIAGLLLFLPPYLGAVMGAGDVKVFSIAGLAVGIEKIFTLSLYVAIAGGFLALLYLLKRATSIHLRGGKGNTSNTFRVELPYVVAIFGGLFYMLITERLT
mgnify:CR=1 FL=1